MTEILRAGDELRRNALDRFGPLAPMVTAAFQLLSAAVGFIALAAGKTFWAPPTPLANFPVRIAGLLATTGVVGVFVWSKNGGNARQFLVVTAVTMAIGVVAGFVYLRRWFSLCFKCEHDSAVYVRGLTLNPNAAKVLSGDLTGLPPAYVPSGPPPTDEIDYFCNSGKSPTFIWSRESYITAQMRLVVSYVLFMVPIVIGLAGGATALSQPEIKVAGNVISMPGDILFAFDKTEIRPGAAVTLDEAAKIMRQRGVSAARIEGHTDSIGTPEYNEKLSLGRAEAVRQWLLANGGLGTTAFTVAGLGAGYPVAPNKNQDGSDNAEGQARNRRVTIVLDR